jgi:hypothetical protein
MITPSFGLTATERVLPRLALDFTTASLDPRVTFTRTGNTATVTNSSGYVVGINADLPRFDYDPITLVCKGLLIEEARTNLFLYSAQFDDAYWTKTNTSVTANTVVAPDGALTAEKLSSNATGTVIRDVRRTTTYTAGFYTLSVYAKAAEVSSIALEVGQGYGFASFDLSTGQVTGTPSGTANIISVGNGWYRCSISANVQESNNRINYIYLNNRGASADTPVGNGVYIWGAQLEAGAFPTSYIPTVASQVTRTADVATMTGTNFSDWYNASEGTFQSKTTSVLNASVVACASDGTANNSIFTLSRINLTSGTTSRVLVSNVEQAGFVFTSSASNSAAIGYKASDFVGSNNGATPSTDTSGTLPIVNRLQIGALGATTYNCIIAKINYWPFRLTNAQVQAVSKG